MIEINKIYNMDCLEGMDLMIKQGMKVDAIITDIPYGTTACEWDIIIPFNEMWQRINGVSHKYTPFVTFASEPFASLLRCSNLEKYKYDWIWDKEQGTNQFLKDKQPLRKHENICVFYDNQSKFNKVKVHSWRREVKYRQETVNEIVGYEGKEKTLYDSKGLKHPVSILPFNRPHWREGRFHTTQKPISLVQYLIQTYTDENDIVLDFTMGSGTTAIACINTGRNYVGFEKKKKYVDISNKRIEEWHKSNI